MLVLRRRQSESIVIDLRKWGLGLIEVSNVEVIGGDCRMGIEAAKEIPIHRREIFDKIERQQGPNAA